jgi:hypothetical protein
MKMDYDLLKQTIKNLERDKNESEQKYLSLSNLYQKVKKENENLK